MNDYTRIFEIIYYQLANFPKEDCICGKYKGKWIKYSTEDVIERMNKVSYALMNLGLEKGDKIAIVSNNRPEWNFVDLGAIQAGIVDVPVYPTISESDYKFIFNHAEVKLCFVSDEDLYQKVSNIKDEVPTLQEIYTFDEIPGAKHFSEFLKLGEQGDAEALEKRKASIKEEDLATLIYTSGTTGTPKGVMLSHRNYVSNVKAVTSLVPMDHTHRALSFLPLCHSFERMVVYVYMAKGTSIYYAESLDTIADNLKEVKPHFFTTVPRLLEKVYEKIMAKGMELKGFKKKLFFWAIDVGLQYDFRKKQSLWYRLKLAIARKLVFSKWKEALGGEVIAIVTGAAALNPKLATLFTAAGIIVIEGYGLTESSPVISVNRFEPEGRKIGTVGIPIPGVEVKIAEDGEILARGPNIMMGYYKRPDLTREAIDEEGWLHTGDVGVFDGPFLKITDRKKELFKTSGGKYIAPQALETKFKESPYIEQIMVVGEGKKFVSALIVPSFVNLAEWCVKNGISVKNNEEMVRHPEVIKLFEEEIARLNKNFGKWEQVKKFILLPEEWSIEGGELTPTMKLKRKNINEKYKEHIEKLYEEAEAQQPSSA